MWGGAGAGDGVLNERLERELQRRLQRECRMEVRVELEEKARKLWHVLHTIFSAQKSSLSYAECAALISSLLTRRWGDFAELMVETVTSAVAQHKFNDILRVLDQEVVHTPLLKAVSDMWSEFRPMCDSIRSFCLRLKPDLYSCCLRCMESHFQANDSVKESLQLAVVQLIADVRAGNIANSQGARSVCLMLAGIGQDLYEQTIEIPLLEGTFYEYESKAGVVLAERGALQYVLWVQQVLECENDFATRHLHTSTPPLLKSCLLDCLIVNRAQHFLTDMSGNSLYSGILNLQANKDILKTAATLMKASSLGTQILSSLYEKSLAEFVVPRIIDKGEGKDVTLVIDFVSRLREFLNLHGRFVEECHCWCPDLREHFVQARQSILNHHETSAFLAYSFHFILHSRNPNADELEMHTVFVLDLLRDIPSRDHFEEVVPSRPSLINFFHSLDLIVEIVCCWWW